MIKRLGLVISPALQKNVGNNINGPCCLLVPDWCSKRLGKFYLYFSDHSGDCIKMAFSDKISGPWKVKNGGVLDYLKENENAIFFNKQTSNSLNRALVKFEENKDKFNSDNLRKTILRFSDQSFIDNFKEIINKNFNNAN